MKSKTNNQKIEVNVSMFYRESPFAWLEEDGLHNIKLLLNHLPRIGDRLQLKRSDLEKLDKKIGNYFKESGWEKDFVIDRGHDFVKEVVFCSDDSIWIELNDENPLKDE